MYLVIDRLVRVRQVKDDTGMRLSAAVLGEGGREIDRAVEIKAPIVIDVDVKSFEVCGGVDEANIACLHEVICYDNVLLVLQILSAFAVHESDKKDSLA